MQSTPPSAPQTPRTERTLPRVLLIDDDETYLYLVRRRLASSGQFDVVGQASNARHGLRLAVSLRPDIILLDVYMPRIDGITAVSTFRRFVPEALVVLHSGLPHPDIDRIVASDPRVQFLPKDVIDALVGRLDHVRGSHLAAPLQIARAPG